MGCAAGSSSNITSRDSPHARQLVHIVSIVTVMSLFARNSGDSDDEGELLAGMVSPPNGYSSADEALSYATPEQTASIQVTNYAWLHHTIYSDHAYCHILDSLSCNRIMSSCRSANIHICNTVCRHSARYLHLICELMRGCLCSKCMSLCNEAVPVNLCMLIGRHLALCYKSRCIGSLA